MARRDVNNVRFQPVSFLDVHVPAHLAFYRSGIQSVTDEDPYAGLLVSMHGAGIYRQRYGTDPALRLSRAPEVQELVDAFVREQESSYAERERAVGVDEGMRRADYERLQWYDRFSLAFCLRGWDQPGDAFEVGEYRFEPLAPWRARVEPWPFAEPTVQLSLLRRLVPKRPWTQPEFARAFRELQPERMPIVLESA